MKKNRVIPVLLLKNGWLVQSKQFERYQNLGNPITAVRRISEWGSDELIYIDISRDDKYDIKRSDQNYANRATFHEIISDVSKETFMPITLGGKIRSLNDIENRLSWGADKIAINTMARQDKNFINKAAKEFGSQCIVVSIDVKNESGNNKVYSHFDRKITDKNPIEMIKAAENEGAGEILLNSVDRDGMNTGYDIGLIKQASGNCSIPIIAMGGVGDWPDLLEGLSEGKADAVAAANIFHFRDQSVYLAKKFLFENKMNVRKPDLLKVKR